MAENEAEKLKVQQEIATSNARSRVFEVSAIDGRGLKIEQYSTEGSLIIRKYNHGEKNMGYLPIKAWGKNGIFLCQEMEKEYGMFLKCFS